MGRIFSSHCQLDSSTYELEKPTVIFPRLFIRREMDTLTLSTRRRCQNGYTIFGCAFAYPFGRFGGHSWSRISWKIHVVSTARCKIHQVLERGPRVHPICHSIKYGYLVQQGRLPWTIPPYAHSAMRLSSLGTKPRLPRSRRKEKVNSRRTPSLQGEAYQ
jgi:hypothetical protein